MAYEDWNKIDEEDEDELQDLSAYETKRDVILFCIDCSESMLKLYDDSTYEDVQTCHVYTALEAAVQIQKRKIIIGPNDSVGILLFNTTRKMDTSRGQGAEIKKNTYLFQPIAPISAPKVQEIIRLLEDSREDPDELRRTFTPLTDGIVPMGDVFTSCNWVLRDGAPKTATKRIFLITDQDDPHAGAAKSRLNTSARTTLVDLAQAGVTVEPFLISTEDKSFDVSKFYSSVLLPTNIEDDVDNQDDPSVLPEAISISRIEDLLSQMRFHEVPKRAQFSIPFELAEGFTIGVKGYGLITEQKKGSYKYFMDLGDRMEVTTVKTTYVDEDIEAEADKTSIIYGPDLGAGAGADTVDGGSTEKVGVRVVKAGRRPFYTAEEVRSFRTLGLEPGIKLLGFKDRDELRIEDNVKHSQFIFPDEMSYSGSKRTFSALLRTMIKKDKIAIVRALVRRNASPTFCALLPQDENPDEGGWSDPAGFHLIPLPFADDIRGAKNEDDNQAQDSRASEEQIEAASQWIKSLTIKNGTYPPDSYPNPALAFHNEQLQASAFREQYDPASFEDLTLPKYNMMHKRASGHLSAWKTLFSHEEDVKAPDDVPIGSKRKADVSVGEAEVRSKYEAGMLGKLRVDQLKEFLKSKGQSTSGKKEELLNRVTEWIDSH
ncbi:SPOC like C-terminal domain-containing protein [Panaeolus papilionaceus]|nr:SPOC like C-terminal domain-containing protein [Panaeolus papilionaceus]